ncbi:MAG: cytochrome c3 family protein, partial [Planctomycetota bacterium]
MTLGWGRLGRPLALLAIAFSALAVVGGGGTYVAMSITTKPEFCGTCHIMKPYVESWRSSSHNSVPCVDCHYEPGLLETFEGKFKALSQLAKYATGTQGTKPWAEVSDYSCMRSGCHSNRLLEGEIQFGKIRFDHRHHLIDLKRGKKLRCTSCHSQIVQGESHLTVTSSTCILCHFKPGPLANPKMRRCTTCHEAPRQPIDIGGVTFLHKDFVDRGVACLDCHGDVTRGDGAVPRARCGSCHNKREHLERYGDDAFLHQKHVADHSVKCLECHMEIEHTIPTKTVHAKAGQACSHCHTAPHRAS